MKRDELNPGDEVYYSDRKTWDEYDNGDKAVVVDAGYWERTSKFNDTRYREVPPRTAGAGVLVKLQPGTERERTIVTPLMYLRGPYAETKARAAKSAAERDAASDAANQQVKENRSRAGALITRAAELGFNIDTADWRATSLTVPLDVVEKLLDAYALTPRDA